MTRKSGKHFSATPGNTGQQFRHYYVSSAVYTVISPTGDRTSDHRMQSKKSTTSHTSDTKLVCHRNCAAN